MHFGTGLRTGALLAAACLAGCSGGGSGGGGSVGAPTAATPTPTPSPTATPTPAATMFSAVGIGTLYATVTFDTNGSGNPFDAGDSSTATTAGGEFGRDSGVDPRWTSGTVPATASMAMQAWGRDSVTGLPLTIMNAPAGATVISPYSALVFAHGNEAAVRSALGLASGTDAIRATLNPLTFNPAQNLANSDAAVARDAARMTSVNLQLFVMGILGKATNGDRPDTAGPIDLSSRYLAELVREGVGLRLTDRAVILAALRKTAYKVSGDERLGRMADYISAYFRAIPALLGNPAEARAWMHAFQFGVLADIQAPGFSAPGLVVPDEAAIRATAATFMDAPAPVGTAFFTTTDYRELSNHPIAAMDYRAVLTGCNSHLALPTCNDSEGYLGMNIVDGQPVARVTAVAPKDPAVLSVTVNADGSMTIARVGGFTGLTWFSYTAQMPSGATATGRAYVRMRPF
ncbi:hypothetical protein [Sphingomonas sp. OTU376]|uniref:hypothetical protein n=1 Tax=Sphingomonas sp. OTU376 TaxID=3043863 RepID=UPI00313CA811